MPTLQLLYPYGYSGGQALGTSNTRTREGHPEVMALYRRFIEPGVHARTWKFQREIIELTHRLLSGSSNWFIIQDSNPNVVDYSYKFLVDTIRYIATGRRSMPISTWTEFIIHASDKPHIPYRERRDVADAFKQHAMSTSTEILLQRWCMHKNGTDDMMYTLNILFGEINIHELEAND